MMQLAQSALLEAIGHKEIIVEPFLPQCVQAGSIDLHLGNRFRWFRKNLGLIRLHNDSDVVDFTEEEILDDGKYLLLRPDELILGITRERITLASDLSGVIDGRSRFARFGLSVHNASHIHPGVANYQVLELTNSGPCTLEIPPGLCICQLIVHRCEGVGVHDGRYAGQVAP